MSNYSGIKVHNTRQRVVKKEAENDKFKGDILQVRLALERTKEIACESSKEAVQLRKELEELANERDQLREQLERVKCNENELFRNIKNQAKTLEQMHDKNDQTKIQLRNYSTEHKKIKQYQEMIQRLTDKVTQQTQVAAQHINAMRRATRHAQRHFSSNSPSLKSSTGLHLADSISKALDSLENQLVSGTESSVPVLTVAPSVRSDLIGRYRMAIVKSNAKVQSLETQLQLEQDLTQRMQKELVYYKARCFDSPEPQDDNAIQEDDTAEISQLKTLCSEYDKTNQQLREKMVQQARVIEKLQQSIYKTQTHQKQQATTPSPKKKQQPVPVTSPAISDLEINDTAADEGLNDELERLNSEIEALQNCVDSAK